MLQTVPICCVTFFVKIDKLMARGVFPFVANTGSSDAAAPLILYRSKGLSYEKKHAKMSRRI